MVSKTRGAVMPPSPDWTGNGLSFGSSIASPLLLFPWRKNLLELDLGRAAAQCPDDLLAQHAVVRIRGHDDLGLARVRGDLLHVDAGFRHADHEVRVTAPGVRILGRARERLPVHDLAGLVEISLRVREVDLAVHGVALEWGQLR